MKLSLLLIISLFSLSITAQNSANEKTFLKNIPYKIIEKDTVKLDIHLPTQKVFDKSPFVVFINGGAAANGDKDMSCHSTEGIKDTMREGGDTVAGINDRLLS